MRTLLALVLSALALSGCGSACQDLAERICFCDPAGSQRDACKAAVKFQMDAVPPSDLDQRFCEATLRTCPDPAKTGGACDALRTPEGKKACGLSY